MDRPGAFLVIAAVITIGTWSLFRKSLHLLFDGVPENIRLAEVRQLLQELPNVLKVHDLHVWAMAASEPALTAHLVLGGEGQGDHDALLVRATRELHDRFQIHHVTLQVESERFAAQCEGCGGAKA